MANISVGGMTPETYDPEKDPRGEIGLALADAVYARDRDRAFSDDSRCYWAEVARVALPRFPELQQRESIHDREIARRLGEIRKTNYDVPQYRGLSKRGKWDLLMKIRADVRRKAGEHCPNVLAEIDRENNERREEARWLS